VGSKLPRSPDGQFIINPTTGTFAPGIAGQVLANPNADYTFGITNNFKYKGFLLSFLMDFQKGGQFISFAVGQWRSAGALIETLPDREQPRIIPGVIQAPDGKFIPNTIQIPAQTYWRSFGTQSDLNVYDATVFRFRELSLGYDFNQNLVRKIHLRGLHLSVFARNLFFCCS